MNAGDVNMLFTHVREFEGDATISYLILFKITTCRIIEDIIRLFP